MDKTYKQGEISSFGFLELGDVCVFERYPFFYITKENFIQVLFQISEKTKHGFVAKETAYYEYRMVLTFLGVEQVVMKNGDTWNFGKFLDSDSDQIVYVSEDLILYDTKVTILT